MAEVLRRLDCVVEAEDDDGVRIRSPYEPGTETAYDLIRRLRASICVLGPLLARRGRVRVAQPGGDAIGSRGLDMHVAGLARMGAEIWPNTASSSGPHRPGCRGDDLAGLPQCRATENLLMAAVLAKGVTEIDNAARSRRSWTSARCSPGWAPTSRAPARRGWSWRGCRAPTGEPPDRRGPHRGGHLGVRRGDD